ncbi:hypothetical protein FPQ18DRAFT_387760 [Pyronema domesticum]|nr:hypothetical protein FPQ18DRAFT_387760 [Pyronema domesticum]
MADMTQSRPRMQALTLLYCLIVGPFRPSGIRTSWGPGAAELDAWGMLGGIAEERDSHLAVNAGLELGLEGGREGGEGGGRGGRGRRGWSRGGRQLETEEEDLRTEETT